MNRTSFKSVIIGAMLALSAVSGAALAHGSPAEKNKELVARYLQAEHRGDVVAMDAMLAPDAVSYWGADGAASKERMLKSVKDHWDVYKYGGKHYDRTRAIAVTVPEDGKRGRTKGDWVYEWGNLSIEYPASPDYGPAKTATFAIHSAYLVENGKIKRIDTYFNHEDIMRQLGYKMLSPTEQAKPGAKSLTFD